MDLKEVVDLIAVRNYIVLATNSFTLDKETTRYMNESLILVDKKIVTILKEAEFKKYVGYQNVQEAVQEIRRITNIKSNLKK